MAFVKFGKRYRRKVADTWEWKVPIRSLSGMAHLIAVSGTSDRLVTRCGYSVNASRTRPADASSPLCKNCLGANSYVQT